MPHKPLMLVIDDDEDLRVLMRVMLGKADFDVVDAADGEAGLALMRTRFPDLIILDLMMPKLDGFGVLRGMQAAGLKTPVIIVTGYSEKANEQILRSEPNVIDLLPKPVKYDELLAIIRRALKL